MIEDILRKSVFYLLVVLIVLAYWLFLIKKYKNINLPFLIFAFVYRLPLIFVYKNFIPGDWIGYLIDIDKGKEMKFGMGTASIGWFSKFLKIFAFETYDYFFAFSLFGYFGITVFYTIIHNLLESSGTLNIGKVNIFPWILLYPSLHVYTVMLGKDPVILYGIALVTLGLYKNINWFFVIIGIALSLLVRPHMGAILLIAVLLSFLFSNELNYFKKSIVFSFLVIGAVAILPQIVFLFRVQTLSLEGVMKAIEDNAGYVNNSGTYVDMANYPMILKMFTYLFRPLFIDSPNVLLLEYSAENLFFLTILLVNLKLYFFKWIKKQPLVVVFSLVYFLLGTLVLSNGLSVFGLFIRQKTMVFLNFIVVLFTFIYYINNKKKLINNV